VLRGGENIGKVDLRISAQPFGRRIAQYALIALFVVMAALVAAVLGGAHAALGRVNRELKLRAAALATSNQQLQVQMEERVKAEEQLRQAQKMQALGQLTGGIAHDFNNLLTVIQGSAELLQRPGLSEEKRARFAAAIAQTAARAATLTSQLLAFARRQPLRPETIDLNERIAGMVELLDSTLGERIRVETNLSPDACFVEADLAQLESAILNVAVNARHAMPAGGRLTLQTSIVEGAISGASSVALAIVDTGTGMDAETLARVFEPFFTTKDVGKGTGLGLSQVYGFAKQSGGEVLIDSHVGVGTTVTLLLPRSAQYVQPQLKKAGRQNPASSISGRVLVVDDNEDVGAFAEGLLTELGFDVVKAGSGEEALQMFEHNNVDVVFSDVVMPGMSGLELARLLRKRAPALPILLTTGFSNQLSEGRNEFPVVFKPYSVATIEVAMKQVLPA
jgi:signal transduction histidine kinase/CheY-like chemotaxis protein